MEIIYLPVNCTMRQAIEKMEFHRYTAVPIVDQQGHYVDTITEGDLLWKMKNTPGLTFENTDKIPITEIPRRFKNETVRIEANVEDLIKLAVVQNFVPVLDDEDIFIGIIRRREIMEYFSKKLLGRNEL
jgi:CBS domain-containing protein